MALATEASIDVVLRREFDRRGVLGQVEALDLFMTPDGTLTEVVLKDASALETARQAVQEVDSSLQDQGVSLLPIVRARWDIERVEMIQTSSPPGVPRDLLGALFKGTLKSGERRQEVWVAVTPSALRVLRPLARNEQESTEQVRAFLQHQLSIGGPGYWNPIRESRQEINEDAARYLRWRPYEALKASVDDIFNPTVSTSREQIESFVKCMHYGGRKIRDFQQALTDLPLPGGSFARGEWLPTSNDQFYRMLLDAEKRQLQSYYLDQVAKAESDFPELKAQYPAVFN